MRFQPGQSGNPAGRPPGSLNKKTIAAQELLAEWAEEIVTNLCDRAMEGHGTAMRLCMDRLIPKGRDRLVAIELPVIKTPEDAELALAVVTDELAAGKLTIAEVSALITAIDRMLRLAQRVWKYQQERLAAGRDHEAAEVDAQAAQAAEKARAPLYSPVNSRVVAERATQAKSSAPDARAPQPGTPDEGMPLPRAA